MTLPPFPTLFQRKVCWIALTSLAGLFILLMIVGLGWAVIEAIKLFQAILIPIAVAAVLAYLLNPLVSWLCRHRIRRIFSVVTIFAILLFFIGGIIFGLGLLFKNKQVPSSKIFLITQNMYKHSLPQALILSIASWNHPCIVMKQRL